MAATDELIAHYRTVLANMREDIAAFEAQGMKLYENQVDITASWLERLKGRADNLERVIRAHERRNA